MQSVSTKTGDKGESGLANGQRLSKSNLIFEVLGTLDELNSHLGLCAVKLSASPSQKILFEIQDTLFHIGAEIAGSHKTLLHKKKLEQLEAQVHLLQTELEKDGQWATKFLLPGGSEEGAYLDIARTVCRRCERLIVSYSLQENVSPRILQYINRLSDFLYVLRCTVNAQLGSAERPFEVEKKDDVV